MLGRAIRSRSCPALNNVDRVDDAQPALKGHRADAPPPPPSWLPPPPAGPALPSPEHTARSIAPHAVQHSVPPLQQATALLTPGERLGLAALDGDQVAAMRLRDLLGHVERDGGVPGIAALLRGLVATDSQASGDAANPVRRVHCVHVLSQLWPRWLRGQGVLDLMAALNPGPEQRIAWADLHGKLFPLSEAKATFRCLGTAHLDLLEILAAQLPEHRFTPPLAHAPPEQCDALVRLLCRCPVAHRHALATALAAARTPSSGEDEALFNGVPAFAEAEWDSLMRVVENMKNSHFLREVVPLKQLLRPLLAVASLGSAQAALFARFVERTGANQLNAFMQRAQDRWLAVRDLDDLTARAHAAMEVADWARGAGCHCTGALLERFFDPALQEPAELVKLLRHHRADSADAATLVAMLSASPERLPIVALARDADEATYRRVAAMLPRAQAVAPWLALCDSSHAMQQVLDVAERLPSDHLPSLAANMAQAPQGAAWLEAVHGCSAAALVRFAQRSQVSDGPRGWLQLAACASPRGPEAARHETGAMPDQQASSSNLQRVWSYLPHLPTEAHQAVWTDDTRLHWDRWGGESVELALRLAHQLPAGRYAAVLEMTQRLDPWVSLSKPNELEEIVRLPEAEQRAAAQAQVLFGPPVTLERRRLARRVLTELSARQIALAGYALAEVTRRGGHRPSDDDVAALLLPVKAEERGKLLYAMTGPGPWSWREQAEFLARVPAHERVGTAEMLHSFYGPAALATTPESRAALLATLRPSTAHRMLQDVIFTLMRVQSAEFDLTALVQALSQFESLGDRRRAVQSLPTDWTARAIVVRLEGEAEWERHLRSRDDDGAAAAPRAQPVVRTPAIAQAWQADENVMLAEHRAAVDRGIAALHARYPQPAPALLEAFVRGPLPQRAADIVQLMNAPHQDPLPIGDACRVRAIDVLSLVLQAIDAWRDSTDDDAATQRGRAMMREALVRNLERCWKPSEHGGEPQPVCVFGQMERMLVPLNGYDADVRLVLVTPAELVNELAGAIQEARGDAPAGEAVLQQLLRDCHGLAQELFSDSPEQVEECDMLARAALPMLRE